MATKAFALHADGLGSVRAVTDGTGTAVERTACRRYGEEVALAQSLTLPETRGFIGERFDDEAPGRIMSNKNSRPHGEPI